MLVYDGSMLVCATAFDVSQNLLQCLSEPLRVAFGKVNVDECTPLDRSSVDRSVRKVLRLSSYQATYRSGVSSEVSCNVLVGNVFKLSVNSFCQGRDS